MPHSTDEETEVRGPIQPVLRTVAPRGAQRPQTLRVTLECTPTGSGQPSGERLTRPLTSHVTLGKSSHSLNADPVGRVKVITPNREDRQD